MWLGYRIVGPLLGLFSIKSIKNNILWILMVLSTKCKLELGVCHNKCSKMGYSMHFNSLFKVQHCAATIRAWDLVSLVPWLDCPSWRVQAAAPHTLATWPHPAHTRIQSKHQFKCSKIFEYLVQLASLTRSEGRQTCWPYTWGETGRRPSKHANFPQSLENFFQPN